MLRFSPANSKIRGLYGKPEFIKFLNGKLVYSFDILSGHSCPYAEKCKSRVVDGKIQDGPKTEFRCFSASQEVVYPAVYRLRKSNFDALKEGAKIESYLPPDMGVCRIHVAGDFFNEKYFLQWLSVAENNPNILFYAYTKSLPYWVNNRDKIPDNFALTASYGGRCDHLIEKEGLRYAKVVYSELQAEQLGLPIDHDDSHAANKNIGNFALLIHGIQPKGTEAAAALQVLRKNKVKHSYSR